MIITLSAYSAYGDGFGAYLRRERHCDVRHIAVFNRPSKKFGSKKDVILRNMYALLKLLPNIRKITGNCVYCTGMHFAVLLVFRIFNGGGRLYLHNFYLHSLGKRKSVKRALRFLLDNNRVTIIVQTPGETDYYRKLSEKIKICFVPYCSDIAPCGGAEADAGYVFTGGYTNRDYSLAMALARRFPRQKFVFVVSRLNKDIAAVPSNVTLYRDIPAAEFNALLAGSRIVVVPLKDNVGSSGQMLCLSAMRNGKPVIYTDVSSINYYFAAPESGFPYQMGNVNSLAEALGYCLENADVCKKYGANAYRESLKYTREESFKRIAEIMGIQI